MSKPFTNREMLEMFGGLASTGEFLAVLDLPIESVGQDHNHRKGSGPVWVVKIWFGSDLDFKAFGRWKNSVLSLSFGETVTSEITFEVSDNHQTRRSALKWHEPRGRCEARFFFRERKKLNTAPEN